MRDGLETLRREFDLKEIAQLIERTALWVNPKSFELLPVWFPEYSRKGLLYKSNWAEPQYNKNRATGEKVHKREGNVKASRALDFALGFRTKEERPNWSCCHIWGVDDPKFQRTNTVVADNRFYSCVANMVLLPTPLKAFTDSMPEIKSMLRICSTHLYGWRCDHPDVSDWCEPKSHDIEFWTAYPKSWPAKERARMPMGVRPLNENIRVSANKRKQKIATDLEIAGSHYPRDNVRIALSYWNIKL